MEIRRGKIYALIFILFIVFLALGGFFLTKELLENDKDKSATINNSSATNVKDLRLNKNEDYIYFTSIDNKSLTHEITFQDIFINIDSSDANNVMTKLNNEMQNLKSSFQTLSEAELSEEELEKVIYKEDDIYKTSFRKYTRYFYKDYAGILIEDYNFDCFKGDIFQNSEAYTFDTITGKLLSNGDLLNLYNLSMTKVKEKIVEKLNKSQTVIDEEEQIDIAETINRLDNIENFALFINKSGFLSLSYLVKSVKGDYNDVIIFN